MKLPRSFGTHSGTFHADEVTACALLLLLDCIDEDKIVRSRDMVILSTCEYICDVGGEYSPDEKKFDHHQSSYKGDLSSAGMILKYFKDTAVISQEEYNCMNRSLIMGVDSHDNGKGEGEIGVCTFSNVISNFVPVHYDAPAELQDAQFKQAVQFARGHLSRLLARLHYIQDCKVIVQQAMEGKKKYLYFDQPLPWIDAFFEFGGETHPALFVLMPSSGCWKLRGIPPNNYDRMKVRQPLPLAWAGLLDEQLQSVTGLPGAVFCHKGRFISVWKTKEDAIAALKKLIGEVDL
jgi:uncharacterized UPF0160 family protein